MSLSLFYTYIAVNVKRGLVTLYYIIIKRLFGITVWKKKNTVYVIIFVRIKNVYKQNGAEKSETTRQR